MAGEFDLISRLARIAAPVGPSPGLVLGIGDDAAVLDPGGPRHWLVSCDLLVEGVHFRPEWFPPRDLGWKALAVSLSDIAAMGGLPRYALVSLTVPRWGNEFWPEEFYHGLADAARVYGVDLIGGDTAGGPVAVADVFLLGEVEPGQAVTRAGARPGDLLLVTGDLGKGAAALAVLVRPGTNPALAPAAGALLRPEPRVSQGRALAQAGATAMIDVSDGLAGDLGHLLERSGPGVAARLWRDSLPVSEMTAAVARDCGQDPLAWVLTGGEDYELLAAVPPGRAAEALKACGGMVVGEIVPGGGEIELEDAAGHREVIAAKGFDHFRRDRPCS
ncbi:MAG: thiamine-phosphate kinase [bacterium]|nr:thiamine-phosphate kinase [bacterium]